jgi:hypothetical protein
MHVVTLNSVTPRTSHKIQKVTQWKVPGVTKAVFLRLLDDAFTSTETTWRRTLG